MSWIVCTGGVTPRTLIPALIVPAMLQGAAVPPACEENNSEESVTISVLLSHSNADEAKPPEHPLFHELVSHEISCEKRGTVGNGVRRYTRDECDHKPAGPKAKWPWNSASCPKRLRWHPMLKRPNMRHSDSAIAKMDVHWRFNDIDSHRHTRIPCSG